MDDKLNPDIKRALVELRKQAEIAAKAHMYYAGEQPDVFDQQRWQDAFGTSVAQPRDDMAQMVVDITVERLKIDKFVSRTGDSYSEKCAEQANSIFKRNRGDQLAPDVHREAGLTRCSGVIVGVNKKGQAVLYPQLNCTLYVHYDPENPGVALWAAKTWTDEGVVRLNMYYPDRTERYVSNTNRWSEHLPINMQAFKRFDVDLPNPLGFVTVFPFKTTRGDLESLYSLMDHGHKALADLMVILDAAGFPQKVLTGVKPQGTVNLPAIGSLLAQAQPAPTTQDATAEIEGGPKRIMMLHSDSAKAFQFDAAPLEGPIKVVDNLRLAQARNGRLPLHYASLISGQHPSGESRKAAEISQTSKVESRQITFGNSWEDVMAAAVVIENSTDDEGNFIGLAEWPDLDALWHAAYTEQGLTAVERVTALVDLEVPAWRILRDEFGYSEEDARALGDEIDAKRAAQADVAKTLFDRGLTGDTDEE